MLFSERLVGSLTSCPWSLVDQEVFHLSLEFSPSGRFLATSSHTGHIRIYDFATETLLRSFGLDQKAEDMRVATVDGTDGSQGGDPAAQRSFDVTNKRKGKSIRGDEDSDDSSESKDDEDDGSTDEFGFLKTAVAECLSWSRDSRRLVSAGSDGRVRVHDVVTGTCLRSISLGFEKGGEEVESQGTIHSVEMHPSDPRICLVCFEGEASPCILDIGSLACAFASSDSSANGSSFGDNDAVCARFSLKGEYVLWGSGTELLVGDLRKVLGNLRRRSSTSPQIEGAVVSSGHAYPIVATLGLPNATLPGGMQLMQSLVMPSRALQEIYGDNEQYLVTMARGLCTVSLCFEQDSDETKEEGADKSETEEGSEEETGTVVNSDTKKNRRGGQRKRKRAPRSQGKIHPAALSPPPTLELLGPFLRDPVMTNIRFAHGLASTTGEFVLGVPKGGLTSGSDQLYLWHRILENGAIRTLKRVAEPMLKDWETSILRVRVNHNAGAKKTNKGKRKKRRDEDGEEADKEEEEEDRDKNDDNVDEGDDKMGIDDATSRHISNKRKQRTSKTKSRARRRAGSESRSKIARHTPAKKRWKIVPRAHARKQVRKSNFQILGSAVWHPRQPTIAAITQGSGALFVKRLGFRTAFPGPMFPPNFGIVNNNTPYEEGEEMFDKGSISASGIVTVWRRWSRTRGWRPDVPSSNFVADSSKSDFLLRGPDEECTGRKKRKYKSRNDFALGHSRLEPIDIGVCPGKANLSGAAATASCITARRQALDRQRVDLLRPIYHEALATRDLLPTDCSSSHTYETAGASGGVVGHKGSQYSSGEASAFAGGGDGGRRGSATGPSKGSGKESQGRNGQGYGKGKQKGSDMSGVHTRGVSTDDRLSSPVSRYVQMWLVGDTRTSERVGDLVMLPQDTRLVFEAAERSGGSDENRALRELKRCQKETLRKQRETRARIHKVLLGRN